MCFRKDFIYLAFTLIGLGLILSSCDSDNSVPKEGNSGLYVSGAKSLDNTNLIFTDNDITVYNISNGEMVFTEAKFAEILERLSNYNELHFFINDNLVFDPPIRIHYGWEITYKDYDLQFRTDGGRVFLTDAYMSLDSLAGFEAEIEAKKEKRNAELAVLINYLSDAGKTVDKESDMPDYIKSSAKEILYFADSLNLVNWTIKENFITAVYPVETDLSSIEPFIVLSERASVDPPSGMKVDFSNGKIVTYTVTAEDGSVQVYEAYTEE